jgi:hypothetical protein
MAWVPKAGIIGLRYADAGLEQLHEPAAELLLVGLMSRGAARASFLIILAASSRCRTSEPKLRLIKSC